MVSPRESDTRPEGAGVITLIEALQFRALRYVRQPLHRFHVLVGPNATGKTTFLDVLPFLSQMMTDGPLAAVRARSDTLDDLLFGRDGNQFQLAIEAAIPADKRSLLPASERQFDRVRYEVKIGLSGGNGHVGILGEKALLRQSADQLAMPEDFGESFPRTIVPPATIYTAKNPGNTKMILHKDPGGSDNFYAETAADRAGGWLPSFRFGPNKSALANVPDDGSRFPVSTWLRDFLANDVHKLVLNSMAIRKASPPGQGAGFRPDGSNLPWVIAELRRENAGLFRQWVEHVRTALPEIRDIDTIERPDDKHLYLVVRYQDELTVPSWMVSDGTLRLLALTLPAYLPNLRGAFLIEEPENGIHPRAIETVIQSLSSIYHAQVLLATHSSVILSAVDLEDILCFSKDDHGSTDIVAGPEHPALRDWKGEANLGLLFAAGVLG